KHFPWPQLRNCVGLLAVIGGDGSLAFHRRAQVLHGIGRRRYYAGVGFMHADIGNLDSLVRRIVPDHYLTPLFYTGLALHLNARIELLAAGPIFFEAVAGLELL